MSGLIDKYGHLIRQIFRYGLVSIFALGADAGLLYWLKEYMGLHYLLAATLSFVCGLIVSYVLSMRFVFSGSKLNRHHEFIVYTVIGLAGLLLNDLIIFLLVTVHLWYMAAKLVSTGVVFFFNFFLRRNLYENNRQEEG